MYWSPNFLAVVFKKQEISQQVVTRIQDLAAEFSKIFRGRYPLTLTVGGGHPSRTQHPPGLWAGVGRKRPGVGTQTLIPLNFSAVVAPCTMAINDVPGEKVYHVWDILREFLSHNSVSGLRTLKPKKSKNLKYLKT